MAWKLLAEGLSVGYDGKALIRNLSFAVGPGDCDDSAVQLRCLVYSCACGYP